MKKYILLLLTTVSIYGQTYQNTTYGTLTLKTNVETTTATKIPAQETSGLINWLQPINIPIPTVPTNYTPTAPTLGGHLDGINTKLGTIGTTTAGISTRVWFTADQTTITAGTFDLTNPLNKGAVAGHQQTVANDDGQKKYFTTDLIGNPFAMITTFPQGTYAGNLSVSTTPTNANQKFTVELYRCNNAGTPIASGVTGAVVGSLGVTVIMIMDSGEVTLANASVTNLPVSTILGVGGFTINAGERIRYHVSAEKVGTAGAVINESVYYGSSYNSFIDVPVIYNSSSIKDVSTVTSGVGTVTDALNNLKSAIPVVYSTVVYVNNTNPNAATIFDDVNPPVVNDNALKANTNNLYVASDNTGWVYNSTSLLYVTKPATAPQSNFYLAGTTIDAGSDKSTNIERAGLVIAGNGTLVGGTGGSGQVSYWNSPTTQSSDSNFTWDNITKTLKIGVTTSSSKLQVQGGMFLGADLTSADVGVTIQPFKDAIQTYSSGYKLQTWNDPGGGYVKKDAVTILSNGRVGFNNTNPSVSLDIDAISGQNNTIRLNQSGVVNWGIRNTNSTGLFAIDAGGSDWLTITTTGSVKIPNLAGTGDRQMTVDAIGNVKASNVKITITTAISITTATTDSNSVGQDGHHVVIDNGVNAINLTCNGGVTTSYGKVGTGAITFVQGSGRTLVQLSGTAILSGIAGSTATLWSNGTTDYLSINNY